MTVSPRPVAASRARWVAASVPATCNDLLASGVSPRLAPLLAQRGVETAALAERYLRPSLDHLHDPYDLAGMDAAVAAIDRAREAGRTVVVIGDYDVDGVSATAILLVALRANGLEVDSIIPHRIHDGYGLQPHLVERVVERGAGLLIAVDCGTTSVEAVTAALEAGVEVVIVDHHLPGDPLPDDAVLVNPKQPECSYPCDDLSAAGLSFKLAQAVFSRAGRTFPTAAFLRMAVLGTVADVVPLRDENRVITTLGLDALRGTRSKGLLALFRRASVRAPFKSDDIGFRIGPRINAAGRLDSAADALELLVTQDDRRAETLSQKLEELNSQRRAAEDRVLAQVRERVAARVGGLPPIIVEWSEEWHQGVVGLGASRISREVHRPAIILTVRGELATGSGRSVPGLDLHELLSAFRGEVIRFGGHAQAIGLTVATSGLESLRDRLEATAAGLDNDLMTRRLRYELELRPEEVTTSLGTELASLEPHGQGNRRPLLRIGPLRALGSPRLFGRGHLRLLAQGEAGGPVRLLGWNWADRAQELGSRFEVLGSLERDRYDGGWDVRLVDARQVGDE